MLVELVKGCMKDAKMMLTNIILQSCFCKVSRTLFDEGRVFGIFELVCFQPILAPTAIGT